MGELGTLIRHIINCNLVSIGCGGHLAGDWNIAGPAELLSRTSFTGVLQNKFASD